MLVTSNKNVQSQFVKPLAKKYNLNFKDTKLLKDIIDILPVCKNNYNHYNIDEIECFFVFPIILQQQINLYENDKLVGFISYAILDKTSEKFWLKHGQKFKFIEWNAGDNIWIIDALSPWGHGRTLTTKLEEHLSKIGYKGKIIRYKRNYKNGKTRLSQSII